MRRIAEHAHPGFPVSIYYAFKQAETKGGSGTVSTGWETFLDAVIRAGFAVTGTWPMRTELSNRMIGMDTNALASSIVLVCRRRSVNAPAATRREYLAALKSELPMALRLLQTGNVAPVDLAQAAIGPGMAVYTRYATVLLKWGPSLEHAAKRTGGVTGIVGSRYFTISAERQQNHAGTTPMALRRDAGRALVEITPGSTTCFRSMPASGGCGPSEITKRLPLPTRLGVWRIEAQSRYYNRAIHRGAAAERSPPRGGWSMRSRVIAGYSWAEVQALRDAGFMGMTIPEAHGGQGRGFLDTALVVDKMMQALGEANSTRSSIGMDTSPITLHEREHDQNRPRP